MCLAVPGQIVEILDGEEAMAKVNVSGVMRKVSLALVPEAKVGDWVIIHVGFALQILDELEAKETLRALSLIGAGLFGEDEKNLWEPGR
ncbi:MAG: HypC/HybG/HupF family hydrogenase formation chaperone [Armatimonadetes bacterium]|nr:HypC/HybG/HupF family hydrogenase formation chaperone [Armatimonadota bacterium]